MIRQAAILILLALVAGALTAFFHPRAPAWNNDKRSPLAINLDEVAALEAETLLWVDARTAAEYAEGHFPGALNLNEDDWDTGFEEFVFAWQPDQTVIVYCNEHTCHASEAVAMRLRQDLGSEAVFFLEDGWGGLQAQEGAQ